MLANFLIYINDISSSSDKLMFYLFADNTNLLYADKNLKSLESIFNEKISRVYNWLIANKLSLNIKKSNFVVSRPRQKKLNHQVNLKVFDHHNNSYISLECNNHVKYLGVLISLACVSSETHNLQCVFLRIQDTKGKSLCQAFLAETVQTGTKNRCATEVTLVLRRKLRKY